MSTSEERIKEVFDEIKMPDGLKEDTLTLIDKKAALASPRKKQRRISSLRRLGIALAACLLVGIIGFGGFKVYATETAVVGIELNPSLELGVNWFGRVIDARSLNSDGQLVLSNLSLKGKSYEEALALITKSEVFLSYVTEDSFVDVSVTCDDERQSADLVAEGQQSISALPCSGTCSRVSSQARAEALKSGMGIGRYSAARTLMSLDPSLSVEDCAAMSMRELRERIAELDPMNAYSGNQNGPGGGPGYKRHGKSR
jgi:hypothetical protein